MRWPGRSETAAMADESIWLGEETCVNEAELGEYASGSILTRLGERGGCGGAAVNESNRDRLFMKPPVTADAAVEPVTCCLVLCLGAGERDDDDEEEDEEEEEGGDDELWSAEASVFIGCCCWDDRW